MSDHSYWYGKHIRGRVINRPREYREQLHHRGHTLETSYYIWQVVNTRTGAIINSDNTCCTLADAITDCTFRVAIARNADFFGFASKAVQP